jgi:acetyl esterase/lipase
MLITKCFFYAVKGKYLSLMKPFFTALFCSLILIPCTCVRAQEAPAQEPGYETLRDLSYRPETTDAYAAERCKLDVYYPTDSAGFATIVYFHGGGLEFGQKHFLKAWKDQGIAVVSANYRLHPKVENPVYTEDAAAAVAWTMKNIASYGGDPKRIYVSGHSAGGYLASMIGQDTTYLAAHGEHPDSLAGLIPFSGHTITHFTPRKERGLAWNNVVVDRYAPIHHLRISDLPIALITGDRELELFGRYEETAYFWRMLVASGHKKAYLYELDGFGHGPMVTPATHLALELIRKWEGL